jgi:transposase
MIRGLMTDEEWAIVEPFLTTPSSRGGRPPANHRGVLGRCAVNLPHRRAMARSSGAIRQLELGLAAVPPLVRVRCVGHRLAGIRRRGGELDALQMIDSTTIRAHRCAAGEAGGGQLQALGRSRGGFTTKVHLRCNAVGLPIGVVLTEGQAHDVTAYDELMAQRDSDPGAMLADKGCDSDAIRHDLRDRGTAPEIPTKRNRNIQHSVRKRLYALRSRIECFIGHLKEQRRIATRFDKTASSFLGFVLLGCIRLWTRLVHRA